MEDRGSPVADYFVVAGLPDNPELVDEDFCEGLNPNCKNVEPITDITVIFPAFESVPRGFSCIDKTPFGFPANLNSGSLRSPEVYLCYKRGRDKPPLVDIGVMYDGKERLLPDAEVIISTPSGRDANVNNTSARTLLTFRRATDNMPCNELVVTDVCVIFQNKGEKPPHAFCIIPKNLNKGMMGCDVYLCYKKSMNRPPLLQYKPEILMKVPLNDRRTCPFPPMVAMFCLPMCATIECWPKNALQPRPVFSTFVLTVADATEKMYGAALTFYENYDEEKLSQDQRVALGMVLPGSKSDKRVHVNKCICLLSHYPFFDAFRTFLSYLNWMVRNGSHEVPVERYIAHILEEVPTPSPQRPHILMQLSPTQNLVFSHPHDSPLPKNGASFRHMLTNLGPENCMMLLLLVITEQKLLIHSLRPDILTAVAEAVSVLTFPFRWICPYVPLCPLSLCTLLQAPGSFLLGVDSRFFDLYEPPNDVTCVDLDTTTISVSEDRRQYIHIKLLPKKQAKILRQNLEHLKMKLDNLAAAARSELRRREMDNVDIDFQHRRKERIIEMEIQESFLRFMTGILKGYRSFLLPITKAPTVGATDASKLFDFDAFLRSRDKSFHKFYQLMVKTQMFIRFIEERSFVSDQDTCLEFFDECIDKMDADDSENVKLVDVSESGQSERTVFVMPPEPIGLPPNATYSYNAVFQLQDSLFGAVKPKSEALNRVLRDFDPSTPGSPIARRTKQEIKSSHKNAKKYAESPHSWAKYLLSTCYSLWFIHLPSYVSVTPSKHMALCLAHDTLVRMSKTKIQPADEVCYRVVMQLCGIYSQPLVAVKVLFEMKRCGITPNAITYGFYNKAVLEAKWPSNVSNSSQLMWNKLRNVIVGVAQFRAAGKKHHLRNRRQISHSTDDVDRISTGSGTSLDSHNPTKTLTVTTSPSAPGNFRVPKSTNGKSQSDSESISVATTSVPTRISSSSDIGYGSMTEPKPSSDFDLDEKDSEDVDVNADNTKSAKTAKFWGQMGKSLDHWVRSGMTGLANVASYAAETSYYSPASLMIAGYQPDYSPRHHLGGYDDEDDDDFDESSSNTRPVTRRLNFDGESDENQSANPLRLLRSVSFGNDTQIMCKLKELKEDLIAEEQKKQHTSPKINGTLSEDVTDKITRRENGRAGSAESNGSLEGKVNKFYEGSGRNSVERDVREETPVNGDHESYQDTIRPDNINRISSPILQIQDVCKNYDNSNPTPASPARTPVTQNDPLGALSDPCSPIDPKYTNKKFTVVSTHPGGSSVGDLRLEKIASDSPKRTCSEGQIGGYEVDGRVVQGVCGAPKGFHRSSTLPNYSTITGLVGGAGGAEGSTNDEKYTNGIATPVVPSLSAISSSLKNPFGRYSPGRLSLRKAGTSLIESTIGGKKAEALMEGFNQFKSVAAVTMKNKIEEIKEAVNNTTPVQRNGPFGEQTDLSDGESAEPVVNEWACVSESYLDKLLTTEPASTRASFASADLGYGLSHQDTPLSSSTQSLLTVENSKSNVTRKDISKPVAVEISITTCSKCHGCNSLLFDEEIMAGWTAEDSNLNTKCPHCKKWTVPFMEVTVTDYRHHPLSQLFPITSASSVESLQSSANLSRRPSMMNPPTINTQHGARTSKEVSGDIKDEPLIELNIELDDELNSVTDKKDDLTLDPLGVIEELHRSRRNSPDPKETSSIKSAEIGEAATDTAIPTTGNTSANIEPTAPSTYLSSANPTQLPSVKLEGVSSDPILVPYLSPLVLRKELENVLVQEGDTSLVQSKFVDEHPIIYWNLVWFFHRANLTSHIKGLCLSAKSVLPNKKVLRRKDEVPDKENNMPEPCSANTQDTPELVDFSIHTSWTSADYRNVSLKCKWDNPKFHSEYGTPLYLHWLKNKEREGKGNKEDSPSGDGEDRTAIDNNLNKLMNSVIKATQGGNLAQICPQLLYHYHKQATTRHFPTYRDVLFLSLVAAGRESVEAYGYGLDKDYRDVYSKYRCNDDFESMDTGDLPPSDTALFCRRYFKELELL